jgi:ribonuclease R
LANIAELVGPLGINIRLSANKVSPTQIIHLLNEVKDTTLERIVGDLVLRSMAKAVYSPENIGHFGLHFEEYTHFTSPIRRYPDVIVHRLLKTYASSGFIYSYEELVDMGLHCSDQEKSAQIAERDSIKLKQVEYLSKRLGQVFDGVVSGVTDFGIFVALNENYCEGIIRLEEFIDDYYDYEPKRHMVTGRRRGRSIRLGDTIKVVVKDVDIEQKQIFFTPSRK